jgi:hypothetical protein
MLNIIIREYSTIMKVCPKCNSSHNKPGIYCSRKCANSRVWSDESKKKRSDALKKFIADNPEWKEKQAATIQARTEVLKETLFNKGLANFLAGNIKDRSIVRKWLIKTRGEQCECCNHLPEWNGKYLALQVHHVNGKNKDNRPNNLQLLCPNCHTQTDTFAGRNIKNNLI